MGEVTKKAGRPPSLTPSQVADIRASGEKQEYLATLYGVGAQSISKIQTGELYKHLPGERAPRTPMFDAPTVRAIRLRKKGGASHRGLAADYGCSVGLIQAIVNRRAYDWVL